MHKHSPSNTHTLMSQQSLVQAKTKSGKTYPNNQQGVN